MKKSEWGVVGGWVHEPELAGHQPLSRHCEPLFARSICFPFPAFLAFIPPLRTAPSEEGEATTPGVPSRLESGSGLKPSWTHLAPASAWNRWRRPRRRPEGSSAATMPLDDGESLAQRRRDAQRKSLSLTVFKSPSGESFQGFCELPFHCRSQRLCASARDLYRMDRAQGVAAIATPIHAAPHALRTRCADSSRRFGDTGWAVPSSCANSETLYSSTIHRNSLSNCRPSSVAGGFAWN